MMTKNGVHRIVVSFALLMVCLAALTPSLAGIKTNGATITVTQTRTEYETETTTRTTLRTSTYVTTITQPSTIMTSQKVTMTPTVTITEDLRSTTTCYSACTQTETVTATIGTRNPPLDGYHAIWLEYERFASPSDEQLRNLRKDISDHNIRFVFVFFTRIRSNGTITNRDVSTTWINNFRPAIVVAVMDGRFDDPDKNFALDLRDEGVRRRVADEAKFLCNSGFDGVQLDIEQWNWFAPFGGPDKDGFNSLVRLVRDRIGNDHLSLAVPARVGTLMETLDSTRNWVDYSTLAGYADYLIPMCYDKPYTGLQSYRDWVSSVTKYSLDNVGGGRAKILLGVTVQESHGSLVEALEGAKQSLVDNKDGYAGLSVFIYGDIQPEDWARIDSF